jgi:hypothetical protein
VVWCGVVWCGVVWCGVVCLPANDGPLLCLFALQARQGDDLGKIALRSNIPLDKLLLDNVDQLPAVDEPLAGKLLQLCNPPRLGEYHCAGRGTPHTLGGDG